MVRVLIAESQIVPRQLLEKIVASSDHYQVSACVDTADQAEAYCARRDVDLVLLDAVLKDGASGLAAAERIKSAHPQVRIVMVTSLPDSRILSQARKIGVDSFWFMEVQRLPILEIMDRTMAGEHLFPDAPPAVSVGMAKSTEFTSREIDVLRLLCEGLTDRDIAARLTLSVTTVRYHVNNLIGKTGLCSRTELAVQAVRSGIITPVVKFR